SPLATYLILRDYSDENHILTQNEIAEIMERDYGITLDRRTIYRNIELLQEYGCRVSSYEENKKGYYLKQRVFSPDEAYLACNLIRTTPYLSSSDKKRVEQEVFQSQSKYTRKELARAIYLNTLTPELPNDTLRKMRTINGAIASRKVISFDYPNKQNRKEYLRRFCSPYQLIHYRGKLFLTGFKSLENVPVCLEVSKMLNIRRDNTIPYETPDEKLMEYDVYPFASKPFNAAEREETILRCSREKGEEIAEFFTHETTIEQLENDNVLIRTKVQSEVILKYLLENLQEVELIAPKHLRNELISRIASAYMLYSK
ncbi:MAG: WYL domain-containing transcriptional regulator, partial [Erysipelotrichaceae bacterium]|nr:WYL domain-containing transcriptional regulator [Erysipelotrichaceae bacterium]